MGLGEAMSAEFTPEDLDRIVKWVGSREPELMIDPVTGIGLRPITAFGGGLPMSTMLEYDHAADIPISRDSEGQRCAPGPDMASMETERTMSVEEFQRRYRIPFSVLTTFEACLLADCEMESSTEMRDGAAITTLRTKYPCAVTDIDGRLTVVERRDV